MIKNLPDNIGDMGSIPGPGRVHMLQGSCAHEPWNPCSAMREVTAMRNLYPKTREQPPLAAARESLITAMQNQCSRK